MPSAPYAAPQQPAYPQYPAGAGAGAGAAYDPAYDPTYDPMMGPHAGSISPQGAGAYGMQGQTGGQPMPPPPPPPPKPSKPANFQLGALLPAYLRVKISPHSLKFDEQYFLRLLAGSISLTKDEKARIVESIPKLKQAQIDELIRIFEEERRKFAELGEEHAPQLEKLARQHYEDWTDIETKQEQSSKADEDAKKAEEIRKNLGL